MKIYNKSLRMHKENRESGVLQCMFLYESVDECKQTRIHILINQNFANYIIGTSI